MEAEREHEAVAGRLDLLGACELQAEGHAAPLGMQRHVQVLVYVVLQKQWVSRERLALLFWPDHAHAAAMRNVRKVVHLIGAMPQPLLFEARQDAVRCLLATDVDAFEGALAAGRREEAIASYRGELAPGLEADAEAPYAEWLRAERARLAGRWRAAVLAVAGEAAQASRSGHALAWLERLLAADPLDEDALALALPALRATGRAADAQRLYRAYTDKVAAELGIEPSARLRVLAAEISAGSVTAATAVAAPVPAGVFVGRRLELRRVAELLADESRRALVLHGPGGVGKSRLAREALTAAAPRFADGAHWVPLEDLAGEAQVPARISQAAGLEYRDSADTVATLAQALGSRHLLLVLDNAEHLPGLGAQLARLLAACERLRVVVTSREKPAALAAELLTLDGLDVPDDESLDEAASGAFDATQLFVARARFHQPSFALADHLDAVNRIVRSVQGLPLAIEMAAAWVRLLPPAEIAQELQSSIDVLERDPSAGAPARREHLSVRATLQRSWALLAPKERAVLAALAVFSGGFTREAAQAVADASLPLLAALVDKSLVQADRASGRFDLHPLVAAFAWGQAGDAGRARVARAHMDYYAAWLKEVGPTFRTDAGAFGRRIDAEGGNCRRAWLHAASLRSAGPLYAMAGPLSTWLENVGRYAEGITLASQALGIGAHTQEERRALAAVCKAVATLEYRAGDYEGAERHARQGLSPARLADDSSSVKGCLNLLGLSLWNRNRHAQALPYFEAALKQAQRDGDRYGEAVFSANSALVARDAGDFDKSLRLLRHSLAIARELGNVRSEAISLHNIGNHYRYFGQWDEATRCFNEGLALTEQHGITGIRANFLGNLGLTCVERGALEEGERRLQQTLALQGQGAETVIIVSARLGMAQLHAKRGDLGGAHGWLASAVRLGRVQRDAFNLQEAAIVLAELKAAAGDRAGACAVLRGALQCEGGIAASRHRAQRLLDSLAAAENAAGEAGTESTDPIAALDDVLLAEREPGAGGAASMQREP